jgi:hypothetical protein
MATSGDFLLATDGDFLMAMDTPRWLAPFMPRNVRLLHPLGDFLERISGAYRPLTGDCPRTDDNQ